MLSFRRLDIEDKLTVQKYTLRSKRRNCDLTFANLYSWRFLYLTEIAEYGGFLLFRFYVDGELSYMLPVGEGDIKPVMEELMSDARMKGVPFVMYGVCKENCDELESLFPGKFVFTSDRDYSDYLYLHSDLSTLVGKKFQPKRNHVNKFRNTYPGYEFKPLTRELIPECIKLELLWCRANNCSEDEALQNERESMNAALRCFEELDIIGGVLAVDGKIVGFTYGAPVNNETFDTCVEKADTDYEGAYAMINHEFAKIIPEQYIYINREEDLGLEGLRKAKLSYQPYLLLEKYKLELK